VSVVRFRPWAPFNQTQIGLIVLDNLTQKLPEWPTSKSAIVSGPVNLINLINLTGEADSRGLRLV